MAHASAKLDTRINAAAAILATQIAIPAILPEFLSFPFWVHTFPRSYYENRTGQTFHASKTKQRLNRSVLTLLSFVLPDRVAALQNDNGVRLRTNFEAADCGRIPADCER